MTAVDFGLSYCRRGELLDYLKKVKLYMYMYMYMYIHVYHTSCMFGPDQPPKLWTQMVATTFYHHPRPPPLLPPTASNTCLCLVNL